MLASKLIRRFGRLHKPKLSKYQNIQEIARDNSDTLFFIEKTNQKTLAHNKNYTFQHQLSEDFGITQQQSQEMIQGTTVYQIAHDAISHKGYWVQQKLGSKEGVVIDDLTSDVNIPYSPNKGYLKFHNSINKDVPIITDLPINKSTAYVFNLPHDVTQKQIMLELGFRFVKNVTIKYCMLGLPAYAVAEFLSVNALTDKIMTQELQIVLNNRTCPIVTHIDKQKLLLANRQIILHSIDENETPERLLRHFSKYGRILNFDYPQRIYREPSVKEIKQLYKDSTFPINIRLHKSDKTIEEEYYPEYKPSSDEMTETQKQVEQNQWRLNHAEIVDVHEGEHGKVKVKGRGFCMITYACVEQAQNCYFRERLNRKCELVHGREQFEFDELHRKQLLRHIDQQFIDKKKNLGEHKLPDECDSELFQNFYLDMTIKDLTENFYANPVKHTEKNSVNAQKFIEIEKYKNRLIDLQRSIGTQYNSKDDEESLFGKSFGELAEQQLFQSKLPNQPSNQRYEIDIGNYSIDQQKINDYENAKIYKQYKLDHKDEFMSDFQKDPEEEFEIEEQTLPAKGKKEEEETINEQLLDVKYDGGDLFQGPNQELYIISNNKPKFRLASGVRYKFYDQLIGKKAEEQVQQHSHEHEGEEDDYEGKRHFSTYGSSNYFSRNFRPKTLEQKVRSHIKYNRFIRDTINEYMGVFPSDKLEEEFYRKKPSFANPQNLKFQDGTPFLPESYSQIKSILEFSTNPDEFCQDALNVYIKENQQIKSMNLDVEDLGLRDLKNNQVRTAMLLADMGVIKQEFQLEEGQNASELVKQLNMKEAQFGQQYRVIVDEETKTQSIAKLAKLDFIYPAHLREHAGNLLKKEFWGGKLDTQKEAIMDKYWRNFADGEEYPEEVRKVFNLPEGSKFSTEEVFEDFQKLFNKYGIEISNKDLQKIVNLPNYSDQQVSEDAGKQYKIQNYRKQYEANKASDYSRDPSEIYVKDKDGKYRVSKFRQI